MWPHTCTHIPVYNQLKCISLVLCVCTPVDVVPVPVHAYIPGGTEVLLPVLVLLLVTSL